MSNHRCANCRRALTATHALAGKLCDKCDWAGGAVEFREEDAPTKPRVIVPLATLAQMMSAAH